MNRGAGHRDPLPRSPGGGGRGERSTRSAHAAGAAAGATRRGARVRPVYRRLNEALEPGWPETANTGLLHDRYADIWSGAPHWKPADNTAGPSPRADFLDALARHTRANTRALQPLLAALHQRRARLWQSPPAAVLELTLVAPLVSGPGMTHALEAGFVWDRNLGVPYLPASSLKGAARAWAEQWEGLDPPTARRIFGDLDTEGAGSVIFHALYPLKPVAVRLDVLNPHFGEAQRQGGPPGDWLSPEPWFFLVVPPGTQSGTRFCTAVQARQPAGKADAELAAGCLREALTTLGAGAKTAVGYGLFAAE